MKVEINRDGIIVKKSICVIEDEQDIRESVKEFFECNDYEVFDYSSAEDFYENKHLNSDLICCNFTELSDEEFYECLTWANQTLMKNYFDKQRNSTLTQIDNLFVC